MKSFLVKTLKTIIGVTLLLFSIFFAVAFAKELGRIEWLRGNAALFTWGFAGFAVLHIVLKGNEFLYVLAHEISHAIATRFFGGRVHSVYVSGSSGSVRSNKSNFVVLLFPYFFPFYALLILALYALLGMIGDVKFMDSLVYALMGLSLSHHLCFTVKTLRTEQSDIKESGSVFSYGVIVFLNIVIFCLILSAIFNPISFTRFFSGGTDILERILS